MTDRWPIAATITLLLVAASAANAQNQIATQDLWVLDYVNNTIRVFDGGGSDTGPTIALAGSGSARGFGFNDAGLAYVARGQDVRTYDGVATAVFADAADGIDQAQDVAVRPGAAQEVWVACGATPANSKIIKFSSAGAVLQTLTNANLDHPRRIEWNADGSTLFVTSATNKRIFSVDPATAMFTELVNLTTQNMIPIGLCFDVTRNAVWVTGDFGANGNIGFVDVTTGAYTNVLGEGQFPGLLSQTNVYFDRFRTLNVAARNLNGGVAGVYRFDASSGAVLAPLGVFATALTSVMDVAPRPEVTGIGAPLSAGAYVLNASMAAIVDNVITFSAPRAPNAFYAAALSPRWQTSCSPYVPGVIDPGLRIAPPDLRGVPLSLADGGFLVSQTAAICCFPATPAPINTVLEISGFAGALDANGNATATIRFLPAPAAIDGVELSPAFITVDLASPSLFGRISDPICLTISVGP